MTTTTQAVNADDAVAITAEFFASLDNVQAEAAFLLEEIRLKDIAIMEHLRKAESRGNSLYRSVRQPQTGGGGGGGKDTPLQPPNNSSSTTLNPATPKDAQNHSRVIQEYTKIESLQEEKIRLGDTLTRIVTRHRERARDEWRKIVGEEAVAVWDAQQEDELARVREAGGGQGMSLSAIAWQVARMPMTTSVTGTGTGTGSVGALIAQLVQKGGLAGSGSGWSTPGAGGDERSNKKRKSSHLPGTPAPGGGGGGGGYFDVPLPSSRTAAAATSAAAGNTNTGGSPHPLSTAFGSQQTTVTYSHHQQQQGYKDNNKKSRARNQSEALAADVSFADGHDLEMMDSQHFGGGGGGGGGDGAADGRVDGEGALDGDGGAADDTLYCFCQEKSHGQMIGCDNETCRFEWFHVKCMKLDPDKLPERWFCPECVKILGYTSSTGEKAVGGDKAAGYKKGNKGRKK
ncbi:hypothetical protein QFC21_006091 [Naganishia friedmannii]|uniref:Uncharacterized protein n=1 Tax=Naganishia friedmannii TaxID=89922 RepID=A0ACC2V578_9TREE|nr:hypothetical protein QFC21_006091 [Naganishia friedmannii]